MFRNTYGKLLVYASPSPRTTRFRSVRSAAEETAKLLNLEFGMVKFKRGFSQIYVYYEDGNDEPVPIYCDEGKHLGSEEICSKLRRMMFVLSFHPRHSALKRMRPELIGFS